MKVLVADKFEASGLAGLEEAGCDVVYSPDLKESALTQALRDTGAEVLIVRGTPVTAPMFDAGKLALVVRAGAGYNTIDVAAASRRGIYVSNCPGKNAIAVAELAFGLILALDRRIPDNVTDLRAGVWNKKEYSNARGLFGRTLGLIGYGSIGQEVARRARGFGMMVVAWSRRLTERRHVDAAGEPLIEVASSGEEVAARADVLSIHLALTRETRGFVGSAILDRLKPGAYVINTARAEVMDTAALERVIRERGVRAGLDVFEGEPPGTTTSGRIDAPIVALPGVYGTHHIGGSTDQAQEAIAAETVRVITLYKTTGKVPNVVNLATSTPATHRLIVRHRDRPGVLAHVFDRLRLNQINVQETENIVFDGAEAAIARINIDGPLDDALLASIRSGNSDVLDLRVVSI
jgi:D-3-phosphoglycerate dehydrogenase / 2-oxoglutarate reductase